MKIEDFLKLTYRQVIKKFKGCFDEKRPISYPKDFIERLGLEDITDIYDCRNTFNENSKINSISYKKFYCSERQLAEFKITFKYSNDIYITYILKNNSRSLYLSEIGIHPYETYHDFSDDIRTKLPDFRYEVRASTKKIITKESNISVYDCIKTEYNIYRLNLDVVFFDMKNLFSGDLLYEYLDQYKTKYSDYHISNLDEISNYIGSIAGRFLNTIKDIQLATEYIAICYRIGMGSIPRESIEEVNDVYYFFYSMEHQYSENCCPLNKIPDNIIKNLEQIKEKFYMFSVIDDEYFKERGNIEDLIEETFIKFLKKNNISNQGITEFMEYLKKLPNNSCPNYKL